MVELAFQLARPADAGAVRTQATKVMAQVEALISVQIGTGLVMVDVVAAELRPRVIEAAMASIAAGESLTDQQIGRQIERRLSEGAFSNVNVSVQASVVS